MYTSGMTAGEPARLEYIDALRGWAVLGVLVVHAAASAGLTEGPLAILTSNGRYGVQLFYLVSAFALTSAIAARGAAHSWRDYAIRRFCRIAPMWWVAMGIYLLANALTGHARFGGWQLLATGLFMHGWHPAWINQVVGNGWSVAVESAFYLLLPILVAVVTNLRRAVLAVALSIPLAAMLWPWADGLIPESVTAYDRATFAYLWLPSQLPVFCMGLVLFHALPHLRQLRGETPGSTSIMLILSGIAACYFGISPTSPVPGHVVVAVLLACLTAALALYPSAAAVNRITIFMGKTSFSLYLLHGLALPAAAAIVGRIFAAAGVHASGPVAFASVLTVLLLICVPAAWATYRLIELPGMALGKLVIERLKNPHRLPNKIEPSHIRRSQLGRLEVERQPTDLPVGAGRKVAAEVRLGSLAVEEREPGQA
jgi:peptidoglycan/LPS O-acetylase OafA/YrhL